MFNKEEFRDSLEKFNDTKALASNLYSIAHDERLGLDGNVKYYMMEARDNLIGLYDLCHILINEASQND